MDGPLRWTWIGLATLLVWQIATAPLETYPLPLVDLTVGDHRIDARTALFLVLAAMVGGPFVLSLVAFGLLFVVGLVTDAVYACMSRATAGVVLFLLATLPLVVGFFQQPEWKAASLGAYLAGRQVVDVAREFDPVLEVAVPSLD